MKPGYMTSVCPKQTLPELIATAKKHGYQGLEFRVEWDHNHGVELDSSAEQIRAAKQMLADNDIAATCIATGVKFNSAEAADHLPQRETLRRYITLAADLGVPTIRTFSDSVPEEDEAARNTVLNLAAESYAAVDEWAKQHAVQVLVETHTNMRAHWARQILDTAAADSLSILWDPAHHLRYNQPVADAYPYLRGHVPHLHYRSDPESTTLTDAANQEVFNLLAADGFSGFFSLEIINPADSEAVLAYNIAKYHQYMQAV